MYAWSAPRATPRIGVETLNGKIGHSGKRKMCAELIALPGVGRPSHRLVAKVNASGTNAPRTWMSLLAVPLSPPAYHVSRTSHSDFGTNVQIIRDGAASSCSKMGVPRTAQLHRLLPLENCQSPRSEERRVG